MSALDHRPKPSAASGWVAEHRADLVLFLGAAVVATLLGYFVLGLAGHMASVPLTYSGDGLLHSTIIKGLIDTGQSYSNSALGAPGLFQLYDFPSSDGLLVLPLWLLSRFTSNYVLVLNLFALLTYPLIALGAVWAFRRLEFSRASAFVFALLYALLPFHQSRVGFHLYLAAYYGVPLAIVLITKIGFGSREPEPSLKGLKTLLSEIPWWTWLLAVAVGMAGVYYAFFALVLMVLAAVVNAYSARRVTRLVAPALMCVVIVLTLAAQFVPSYVYWKSAGKNNTAQTRVPSDSDLFGLRMTELIFPMTNHRVPAFARIKALYMSSLAGITDKYRGIANDSALGILGAFGFFVVLFWAVTSPLRGPPEQPSSAPQKLALLGLGSFLLATVGGIGGIIAYLGFPQIRAYDRITVYIGFIALAGTAWIADAAARRILRDDPTSTTRRVAVFLCFAAVLTVGILDTTSPAMMPSYASIEPSFNSDQTFVREIEASLPTGSSVFQLPYVMFPESAPVENTGGYDPLRLYLHSNGLRWSAGAFSQRDAAVWLEATSRLDAQKMTSAARGKGFSGIEVDRDGYSDGGAGIEAGLKATLGAGVSPIVSPDGRYAFYAIGG